MGWGIGGCRIWPACPEKAQVQSPLASLTPTGPGLRRPFDAPPPVPFAIAAPRRTLGAAGCYPVRQDRLSHPSQAPDARSQLPRSAAPLNCGRLNPESATTDRLVALVRRHREGEEYSTAEVLLGNLPKVPRALCDHLLSGEATALDVAYRIASLIDAIECCPDRSAPRGRTH